MTCFSLLLCICKTSYPDFQPIIHTISPTFSVETEQSYTQRYYMPAKNDVEQVISDIHGPHFNYIDEVIEDLERAKGNGYSCHT